MLLLFLGLISILSLTSNKDKNLKCDVISIITRTKDGQPAVKLVFQYEWSNMPIRLSRDMFNIRWSDGWDVQSISIKLNDIDRSDMLQNELNKSKNGIVLQLNSNKNLFSREFCQGEIILTPKNHVRLFNDTYSEASVQYIHKNLFKKIVKSDAVGWENRMVLFKD